MNRKSFFTLAVAAVTLALPSVARAAAFDIFLTLKGTTPIPGESMVSGRTGAMEIRAFEHQLTKSEKGATSVTVVFVKSLDGTSPRLNKALHEGEPLEARFSFARLIAGGGAKGNPDFYTIEGKQGRIVSIQMTTGGDVVSEQVTMTFTNLTYTHISVQKDGSLKPGTPYTLLTTGK